MKTMFRSLLAVLLLATASAGMAQDDFLRWSVAAHAGTIDLDVLTKDDNGFWGQIEQDRSHLGVSLAFDAAHWLGFRAMLERATGFGMGNRCPPDVVCPQVAVTDEADLISWTLAALPRYHLKDEFSVYGIVGAQFWDVNADGALPSDSGTEFAVGAGVGWRPMPRVELGLEYQHTDLDFDALRFNIGYRF